MFSVWIENGMLFVACGKRPEQAVPSQMAQALQAARAAKAEPAAEAAPAKDQPSD